MAQAEDWEVAGTTYHDVKVTKVEADLVSVTFDGGAGRFNLSDLTPELKQRLKYDASKAKAAADQRAQAQAQVDAQVAEFQREQAKVKASEAPPVDNSGKKLVVEATVTQIVSDGFFASIISDRGTLDSCFIKCDPKGIIEQQAWHGTVVPIGTYTYESTNGASHTIAQFTNDLTKAASDFPQFHTLPRSRVSSTMSVGGG